MKKSVCSLRKGGGGTRKNVRNNKGTKRSSVQGAAMWTGWKDEKNEDIVTKCNYIKENSKGLRREGKSQYKTSAKDAEEGFLGI